MASLLDDERIQFYLRHRDDIRAWAQIESEVTAAVREILGALQPTIDERLAAIDADVTTTRRDGGRWERILAQRPAWPGSIGVALEWEAGVDPFGTALPKIGVIFLSDAPNVEAARVGFLDLCRQDGTLLTQGYKVPGERVWPVLRRVPKSSDWWVDIDAWASGIVDAVVDLWHRVAPRVDTALLTSTRSPGQPA